jgi:hypothetical protein
LYSFRLKELNIGAVIFPHYFIPTKRNSMIHGVYLKNRPTAKWHLVSLTSSPEAANWDIDQLKKQALLEGYENAEVGIQSFESNFYIPEFLTELKEYKPQYN